MTPAALPDVPAGLDVDDPAAPPVEPVAEPVEPVEPVDPVRPFKIASIASMWRIASWFPALADEAAAPEGAEPVAGFCGLWLCDALCSPAAEAGDADAASALLVLAVLAAPAAVEDAAAGDEPADGAVPAADALGVFEAPPAPTPEACSNCFR